MSKEIRFIPPERARDVGVAKRDQEHQRFASAVRSKIEEHQHDIDFTKSMVGEKRVYGYIPNDTEGNDFDTRFVVVNNSYWQYRKLNGKWRGVQLI
jgi:hypothetical protein